MARRVVPLAGLAVLAIVASAGCGKSKERGLYEQRQQACAGVQGLTVLEARQVLLANEGFEGCFTSDGLLRIEGDTCGGAPDGPYQEPVCIFYFAWLANDPGLCSNGNCLYFCDIRVNEADVLFSGTSIVADDAPICAHEWLGP